MGIFRVRVFFIKGRVSIKILRFNVFGIVFNIKEKLNG